MRYFLGVPWVYEFFQKYTGFSIVRKRVLDEFLNLEAGSVVIDIGCGPGHICTYLPKNTVYYGFDTNAGYIRYAEKNFGDKGQFFCRAFDDSCVNKFEKANVVMLNGVLHHMDDIVANETLQAAYNVLQFGGKFLSLDGCYREGQPWIAKKLLDLDRGRFVRDESGYRQLALHNFECLETHVRSDLSFLPYTFIVMLGTRVQVS